MYKVLIIDDEPIIVEGLSRSVPWEKYGCQVLGTAGSGTEGRKLIEQCHPDMIFLDICMPEMDGLTMMAISTASKNPERAMMFLNLLNTDPYLMTLLNYGVEGVHYNLNSDKLVEFTDKRSDYQP